MGTISNPRAIYGLLATGQHTKTQVANDCEIGLASTTLPLTGATKAYCVSATLASASDTLTIDTETGIATIGTTPVAQVETATVVAAAGATSNGNLAVTVTGARITGSPLAVSVPLTTAANTAALVAAQIRARFNATAAISSKYFVAGTGADVTLTEIDPQNNDATLNIAIAAGLGVSAITTSTDTTAGVGGVKLTNNTGDGDDFEGIPLGEMQDIFGMCVRNTSIGSFLVDIGGGDFAVSLDEGAFTTFAKPGGTGDLIGTLTITASTTNCAVEITIIAQ
jgi:hypothetical protein